jgi:broad specificity phosphatase PhoE
MAGHDAQKVFLVRHGETAWSLSGQHTSLTDLALTERGQEEARLVAPRLAKHKFTKVFCSPMQRAQETCRLTGLSAQAQIDDDLREWNYGQYEGLTTAEIRKQNPNWLLFRDGAPGGESPEQVSARADRMVQKIMATQGDVAIFAHGHITRVLGVRWIGFDIGAAKGFSLSTASLGTLGFERETPVIQLWNDVSHLGHG